MSKQKRVTYVTECGIPGIGEVPFGIHMCHLYPRRQHLIDSLVPYFKAGLSNNERCFWITAPPLTAHEAKAKLEKSTPDLASMIEKGQMRIIEAKVWHKSIQGTNATDAVRHWLREEEKALADGYEGMRITVNTSFLTPEEWDWFMDYESNADKAFQGRRIVALCSYNSHHCHATGILEVIKTHRYTLDRRDANWEVLRESSRSLLNQARLPSF